MAYQQPEPNPRAELSNTLLNALRNNNEQRALDLIKKGADVNFTFDDGKTLLLHAIFYNSRIVSVLLDAGADVNATDDAGKTALMHCAENARIQMYRWMRDDDKTLIQEEANVNIMNKRGETSAELVTELLEAGADVSKTDNEGRTALMYAARPAYYWDDQDEIVLKILIDVGGDVSATDNKGKTALMYAIQHSKENIAHVLLDAGADHSVIDSDGKSALFFAAIIGNESVVQRLIKAGADLNITDKQGNTALMYAMQNGRVNVAIELIDSGADTNIADNEGNTALIHWAIYSDKNGISLPEMIFLRVKGNYDVPENNDIRDKKIISKLIEVNTDLNATNNEGKTALIYAIQINRGTTAYALLDAGADHSVIDSDGKTALMHSLQSQHNKQKSLALIKAGADVNISDHNGSTALFYGLADEDVIHALIEDGYAAINKKDCYGRSVLFYSITKSLTITHYLLEKGGNLNVKDNCSMSIISFWIENLMGREDGFSVHLEKLNTLVEKRIQPNTIFEAIINAVFCKIFHLEALLQTRERRKTKAAEAFDLRSSTNVVHSFDVRNIIEAMHSAKMYIAEQVATKKEKIEKVIEKMKEDKHLYTNLEKVADLLDELGANPTYADADGNTALHYATCLPLVEPHETTVVMTMCQKLEDLGVSFNAKNHKNETPLLFCLSKKEWMNISQSSSKVKTLVDICKYLLEHGSSVEETTRSGKSVFHLMLELFQEGLHLNNERIGKEVLAETMKILELFPCSRPLTEMTVNKRDANLNSPLHLWAMLELHLSSENDSSDVEHNTLKKSLLGTIFKHLVSCGVRLNGRNKNEETPMHLCRSWTAVKLLIDAGANPKIFNSEVCSPLLVASKKNHLQGFHSRFFYRFLLDTFEHNNPLYEDVSQEPKAFWKTVLNNDLDPWAVDNHGASVSSILIQVGAFDFSKALVEVACEEDYIQSDAIASSLLNAVCQDSSTRKQWKSILVEMILKSRKAKPISYISNEDTALHLCCRNIVKPSEESLNLFDKEMFHYHEDTSMNSAKTSVHWTIAKQLLTYGMDCNALDASGQSCLDIAKKCPALKSLLLKPLDIDEVPLAFPWTSISTKYKPILSKVARRQKCKQLDLYWYYEINIQKGSFGLVFAGMNEKDGREVAIKRIEKLRNQQLEADKKEIKTLTALADCEQVVRYLSFTEDEHFCYVVLELMEGNLNDYLDGAAFDDTKSVQLCDDMFNGLKYLHQQNILHRDLKPSNILFKTYPKLCLKIADFGLSRRIDTLGTYTTSSGSVVGTRCWIAPEVLKCSSKKTKHQMACDVFSAGLVIYYILSGKKHPFTPADCENKSDLQISNETEANIIHDRMESFRCSILCPEATDLVHNMLDSDPTKRPTAAMTLTHPFFWPEKKKMDFLSAVGNQPEFKCPRTIRKPPLTNVEIELDGKLKSMIMAHPWDDAKYVHMPTIYTEMTKKRKPYDTSSVVELVRFIRNTIAHISEDMRPTLVQELVLQDFVFVEYFPNLVMEVFKCVKMHGWDSREEIKYQLS